MQIKPWIEIPRIHKMMQRFSKSPRKFTKHLGPQPPVTRSLSIKFKGSTSTSLFLSFLFFLFLSVSEVHYCELKWWGKTNIQINNYQGIHHHFQQYTWTRELQRKGSLLQSWAQTQLNSALPSQPCPLGETRTLHLLSSQTHTAPETQCLL